MTKSRCHSIAKRLPVYVFISFFVLILLALSITFNRVESRMIDDYRRMADGVTNLMIDAVDPDKLDYYIEKNYSSPEYLSIMKYFYQLKANYPDVFYMYVYRFYKDEHGQPMGKIIIDLEDEYTDTPNQVSIDWVGSLYDVLEPFASKIDELITSREPVYDTAFSQDDGYLLSFAKPFFDKDGNYAASACVDFSMQELHAQNIRFIATLGVLLLMVSAVVFVISIFVLRRMVTKPLLLISNAVSSFKYDSEEDHSSNLEALKKLGIKSNNEIGILYDALFTAEKDSAFNLSNFKKAENEIHIKDKKITALGDLALRDSMTRVGNKAAYTAKISELRDDEQYGIVLMDANNLKMVNDTYGHDAGDEYLKGCCKILCDVFTHSPVFRIGGDEFAAILKGRDFENRLVLVGTAKERFRKSWNENKNDPVHRYSGSIGMADSTICKTVRETIKTADDNMYQDKRSFKDMYGSYR
ncbi:MAG: diguanylate cyclase [Treponema sp.]|nr:diguanylate cyclase [Treponema sp.]